MKNRAAIRWLLSRVRRRLAALCCLTAAYVGQALLGVAFALGTRRVIDSAISGVDADFVRACVLQAAIILGILVCLLLHRHLRDRLTADLDRDFKRDLLHGLLHGDYAEVSAFHSGELLNRMNNDVRIVSDALVSVLPGFANMIVKLVAAFVVLAALEPLFALLVVIAGVLVVAATALLRRSLKALNKRVSESDGRVLSFLQETLEKLLMVQAMDVSDEMERRSEVLLQDRFELQRKRKNVSLFANMSVSTLSYLAGFAALVWCAVRLLHGQMSFGSLTAVTQLVGQLQGPFVNLSGVMPQYIAMTAAAERLMELDAISGEAEKQADARALYASMDAICAENLRFSYDREQIFDGAAFRLPKGAFAVVTGASGIGKSTLLKLLLGIFRPDGGALYLDAARRVSIDRTTRNLFAYVPQGNLLLSGTLRENLTITRPAATEQEVREAVFVSGMDEFLPLLPDGLDTLLGESGAGLSEGQAQRLAIGRAVLSGAPILLLDEATSALDEALEATVLARIRALGRTCIAVTHRPAARSMADCELAVVDRRIDLR